jgi:hypothetical protein
VTNHLTICSLTTDGSGNINVVSDARTLGATLLPTAQSSVAVPGDFLYGAGVGATFNRFQFDSANRASVQWTPTSGGSAQVHAWNAWNGSSAYNAFAVGGSFGGAGAWIGSSGQIGAVGGQATAGSFGVAPIVGALANQAVADALVHNFSLVASIPATGFYRISAQFYLAAGTARKILFSLSFTQGHSGNAKSVAFVATDIGGGLLWDASGSGESAAAGDATGSMLTLYLQAASTLTLRFQDASWASGTNLVSGVCERLL